MKKVIIIVACIVALGAVSLILFGNKQKIDAAKVSVPLNPEGVPVSTEKVVSVIADNKLVLNGTTIPIRETQLAARTAGEITEMKFSLGSSVGRGATIAKIDDKLKQLTYENAKIAADKAETDYKKIKNMYDRNAVPENQFREAKFGWENAVNRMNQAKRDLELTHIVAPFAGMVTQKMTELGAYVNPGSAVCKITDVSGLKISVNVAEKDAYQLSLGKKVNITCSIYPEAEYEGSIIYISPIADKGHNYAIEISIANSAKYKLKSGTFVKAQIDLLEKRKSLLIPKVALIGSVNDAKVYVVSGGVALSKKITVGAEYDQMIEVLDGLSEGDDVITGGQLNLDDNTKVKIINN